MVNKIVPVKVNLVGSEFEKQGGKTVVGAVVGGVIAGPLGAVVGAATQGNNRNYCYTVEFSDGSQRVYHTDKNKLDAELAVWNWRVTHKLDEYDYVDFGIDFNQLERGMLVPTRKIMANLGLGDVSSFQEASRRVNLETGLKKFLSQEITRYFKEYRQDDVLVDSKTVGGISIPTKSSETIAMVFGLGFIFIVLAAIFGSCMSDGDSDDSQLERREAIALTVGSGSRLSS